MAYLLNLKTHHDSRGNLTVIDNLRKELPFTVKRVFYIYEVDKSIRGGHRHKKTYQAAICLNGSCVISNNDGEKEEVFLLDNPSKCLILKPNDWHVMSRFSGNSILLVFASESFDINDYIFEEYDDRV